MAISIPSTEGTEFYVTFMNNIDEYHNLELKLIISAKSNVNVTLSNPQTNWTSTYSIQANQVKQISIPENQAYTENTETIESKGIKVIANAPISLYASNYSSYSYDATIVLPTCAIGTDYIIQTYENELWAKEFAIVATDNNTQVTINPYARTTTNRPKNVPFIVTLNEGETYQIMSLDENNNFSGSQIQSSKPVAVFAGHRCANVPTGNPWCDHIVEQQMPVNMWGKQFVVTKTLGQNGNRVILTASHDNTQIRINGSIIATIAAFESYEFRLTDNSTFIETSEPSTCYLYIEGSRDNGMFGDPSSVHISPLEQQINQLNFATFQSEISNTHNVNIVTTAIGAAFMQLDGTSIASQFTVVAGNPSYKYAQINIEHGSHLLSTTTDGFTGYVYGMGWCESYAYSMGSATIDLRGEILVDNVPHKDTTYDENRCYLNGIEFSPNVNLNYESILWDFGDGTTSTQPVVTHQYPTPGSYTIQMIVTIGAERDTAKTTLLLIDTYRDTLYADICDGEEYIYDGNIYTTAGLYPHTYVSQAGCDSIVTVILNVHDTYFTQEQHDVREGAAYRWHNHWYRKAGLYRDTIPTVYGCDSIFELTINIIDATQEMYDTICWRPTYSFHGYDFPIPSRSDYESQEYVDYTLEYRDKLACLNYLMHLAISTLWEGTFVTNDTIQSGSSYTWRGKQYFETGTYTETDASGDGCSQEYILNLAVLPFPIEKTEAALCTDTPYEFRGKTYSEPGVYRDTAFTDVGIAGIYQLTLTDSRTYENMYINSTGSYTLNGQTYTESGTYVQKLTNAAGCDSILTLYLGINENCVITTEESAILCLGNSFIWNNQSVDEAGDYTFPTTSVFGCDSVVILHVTLGTIKQTNLPIEICEGDYYRYGEDRLSEAKDYIYTYTSAEGCDSIVTITITYKEKYFITVKDTIKRGQTYTWDGDTYDVSGSYIKGYVADNYCDSVVTLDLFVAEPVYHEFSETICGTQYIWDGRTYSESGDHQYTYTSHIKGDSIVTLHLTINPILSGDTTATFCKDYSFIWHGTPYSTEGHYPYTYTSKVTGCDSIVTLHLTQLEPTDSIEIITICHGESHIWHGDTYLTSTTKTLTIDNAVGCDSVCTLQLTVLPVITGDTTATFCNGTSFMWHGSPYAIGGNYQYTYTSKVAPHCDSIVTLHLTQLEPTDSIEDVTICAGATHTWHGQTFITSTTKTVTIDNAVGCDSVCTLNLTVLPALTGDTAATICAGGSFTWWDNTLSSSGTCMHTYQSPLTGCDSIVTLTLTVLPVLTGSTTATITDGATYTWNGQPYIADGDYTQTLTTDAGCDSIVTLHLKVNPLIYEILMYAQCADDPFVEFELQADDGLIHQLQFAFSKKALDQHFRDTMVTINTSLIQIPNSARAGIYDVAVSPIFDHQLLDTRNYQFTLLYPSSVLDQHWDDFIGVLTNNYNGGYDFIGFQWYKNGSPITGENHSYLYQPLEMGSSYSAMLEELDGTKLMTCEIIATPQTEISLYPTLLQPRQIIRLHSSEDVIIWLYDSLGKLLYTNSFERGDSQFAAPQDHGIYIVKIQQTGEKGKSETKKLIVR